nr:hypothetical protein [Tanacetum cinerariifolium]GFB77405.1 hypothetical protein [Tanacetum cinerariifolium]GFB77904.1 hypothetical protein [Tanacetum cinerariifolium]
MEDDDDEETGEIGAETEEKEHHISIHTEEGRRTISQAFQGRVQLDQRWYELTQTYSEVFQTPKGQPPTRPFDPGEMDQSGSYESFGTPKGLIGTGRYMGILG